MTRKGKQPGGHNPLTYHERKAKLADYGTTTARLGSESQRRFGDCCLGIMPVMADAVCTPSGHIYSREAIVSYLLAKSRQLKEQRQAYDAKVAAAESRKKSSEQKKQQDSQRKFVEKDQGATHIQTKDHSRDFDSSLQKKISTETKEEGKETLKRTSYWLAEFQPTHGDNDAKEEDDADLGPPPPKRPPSPMSGNPLRLKDLIPIQLNREPTTSTTKKRSTTSSEGSCICAVSKKAITTQPVIVIKNTGQVMLQECYDQMAKPTMTCPVTGKKFKEKDVVTLQKAASGFASSGETVAKKYRPTLT